MTSTSDVKQPINSFPSDFVSLDEKKTKEYGLKYAKAIYGTWTLNYPINNPQLLQYQINRQFTEGTYPIDIYKQRMGLQGDTSYLNLDFTSVNRIPTIVDNMVGKLMNKTHRIQCNPTDAVSMTKFDSARAEMEADMLLRDYSAEFQKRTGQPLVAPGKYVPEDKDELELHFQMNFKLDDAEAMELALKWVVDNNNFEKDSLPMIWRDLISDKKTAIRRWYDENNNIRTERFDHIKLILPYSDKWDYSNIPYQAGMLTYTIGDICKMNPGFTDEQLYEIAKLSAGSQNGNAPWNPELWYTNYSAYYNRYGATAYTMFSNFYIIVINFYFLSPVNSTKVAKVNSKGRVQVVQKPDGYSKETKGEVLNTKKLYRFEGYWIPNTDYIWDYKMSENIDRDIVPGGYSPECELPWKVIQPNAIGMLNKSIVERMIPLEKQLMLAWLKLQQFMIEAMPPGMAINQNALLDVVQGMGNGKALPMDWMKLYKQTGNIVFTDQDASGRQINIPFKELQGGMSTAFEQFMRVQDYCIQKMNEVVGFNTAVDASTPKADALVGVSQMAENATYDCLRPLYTAGIFAMEWNFKRIALMIQDSLRLGNTTFIEALTDAIGQANVDVLTMGREMPFNCAAISIEIQPDEAERQEIQQLIGLGIEQGTLTTSDVLRVRQQLKTNPKLAGQLLSFLEKKNAKAKQNEALQLQQQNAQVQMQSAQAASQGQAQLDQVLTQNKMAVIQAQAQADMAKLKLEKEYDMKIQEMKNQGAETVAVINTGAKENVQTKINEGKIAVEHIKHESNMQQKHVDHESGLSKIALEYALEPKEEAKKD